MQVTGWKANITVTQPDITFAVWLISQFMHKPRWIHWKASLHILAYLKSTPGRGLIYKYHGHTKVIGYSDSSYAGDRGDRKSTSGYYTFIGGNLVIWRSKRQNIVPRFSAEVEYKAMFHTACEMMWIKSFLTDIGFPLDEPMPIYCDNQANNPVFHKRTEHIEVDCHFVSVDTQIHIYRKKCSS